MAICHICKTKESTKRCRQCGRLVCGDCDYHGLCVTCAKSSAKSSIPAQIPTPVAGIPQKTGSWSFGSTVGRAKLLGYSGSIVLELGVFAPLITIPPMGSINYFVNGRGDGVIVLCLAFLSVLLVAFGRFDFLWFTASGSLAVIVFTFTTVRLFIWRATEGTAPPVYPTG